MHSAVTTAHPLNSRAPVDANSASSQERSSSFDNDSKEAAVIRSLAKRDTGIALWILIIVILVVFLVFMWWWKCIRPRKLAEQIMKGGDDDEQSNGSSKAKKAIKIVKKFL